jgi:hypothetical protein
LDSIDVRTSNLISNYKTFFVDLFINNYSLDPQQEETKRSRLEQELTNFVNQSLFPAFKVVFQNPDKFRSIQAVFQSSSQELTRLSTRLELTPEFFFAIYVLQELGLYALSLGLREGYLLPDLPIQDMFRYGEQFVAMFVLARDPSKNQVVISILGTMIPFQVSSLLSSTFTSQQRQQRQLTDIQIIKLHNSLDPTTPTTTTSTTSTTSTTANQSLTSPSTSTSTSTISNNLNSSLVFNEQGDPIIQITETSSQQQASNVLSTNLNTQEKQVFTQLSKLTDQLLIQALQKSGSNGSKVRLEPDKDIQSIPLNSTLYNVVQQSIFSLTQEIYGTVSFSAVLIDDWTFLEENLFAVTVKGTLVFQATGRYFEKEAIGVGESYQQAISLAVSDSWSACNSMLGSLISTILTQPMLSIEKS